MSTLDSLIRLHRWQLDEHRRQVAALEELAAKLRAEMQRLEAEKASEQDVAGRSAEGAFAYGNYANALIERRAKLQQSLTETEQELVKAREALASVFQEVKRYEVAAARRVLAQRVERDRRQQNEMDDIAIDIHRRKTRYEW